MRLAAISSLLTNNILQNIKEDVDIQDLIIDTRKINNPAHALFFALKGTLRNGHQFIANAYHKGIRAFVIEENITNDAFPEAIFIPVKNTLEALQLLGKHHRAQFDYPVIAITGSNGKTIVKEWLYELLSQCKPFNEKAGPVRSPKSYNSQIGVPLSVWLMQENNTIGIFEAGISLVDEMVKSEAIIKPNIGIFTNIGEAHNEGFNAVQDKINEKLKLFNHCQQLIYCSDHDKIKTSIDTWLVNKEQNDLQLFTWSYKDKNANLYIQNVVQQGTFTKIEAVFKSKQIAIVIPYLDKAYIENAIHCWACLLLLNIAQERIQEIMPKLEPVAMRLQLIEGINNCTLINDSYNSDYTSLKIAIDFLLQQKNHQKKTVILSDILEVRQDSESFYAKVALLLHQKGINAFIGIGEKMLKHQEVFKKYADIEQTFYASTSDFLNQLNIKKFSNETILLKGARSFEFEKIENLLENQKHKTVLEVDLSAIQSNLRVYKSMLAPGVKLMAMVKAFAYGTGSPEVANILQYEGIDYLTVAYLDEGIALRKEGINLPLMVMSPEFGTFDQMIAWKIEPEIFSIQSLEEFIQIAEAIGTEAYPIHIKLDTGMHRLGFNENEIEQLLKIISKTNSIKIQSIFSHLAGSDEANFDDFTYKQAAEYTKMSDQILAALSYKPIRHICNTSAITRFPELQFDMVRLGIGLYGVDANESTQKKLQNVATLKTTIAQIRNVKAGETVGYSRRGKLEVDSTIATVSIGYADGYCRYFGNGVGHMVLNNKLAPTLGSVCMDMCMLNVTNITNLKVGDQVEVFGSNLPLKTLANWIQTIPYEIITSISQRVKRVYINEG